MPTQDEIISLSINVKKLDKGRFVTGKKGLYCDLMLFPTPDSEYGDWMVKQKGTKGDDLPILGNAKRFRKNGGKPEKSNATSNGNDESALDW